MIESGWPFNFALDTFAEPGDSAPTSTRTSSPASPASPDLEAPIEELRASPAFRSGDPVALDKVLTLRRQALGAANATLTTIDGPSDASDTPDASGYTRADLERALPGEWLPATVRRYIEAKEAM